ncbi:MAG: ABC transporter ATP-binding protein [Acidimicrobiia bacterium]|nr:ABC transporter ATP-binding protein [Acidimicrobiia bacterium]
MIDLTDRMTSPLQSGARVIEVRGLVKRYGDHVAVGGVDLDVFEGEIFALLGPNGAGKTTTLEMLEGYRSRDEGSVSVLGHDPEQATLPWRSRIGLVLQTSQMPAELTVAELVDRYAGYYPHPRDVDETIELVGLSEKRDARAGRLSGGQQRRLDVALALVGDPELVFLDEPTTGFDPAARHAAWSMIADLRHLGKTVVLTTHYMEEAEALADRLVILVNGRIAAEGTPSTIGGRETAPAEVRFVAPPEFDPKVLSAGEIRREDDHLFITSANVTATVGELVDWARAERCELVGLEVRRPSLEDVYLELAEVSK